MPLVRIDLVQGKSDNYCRGVGDVVYDALTNVFKVPEGDRFQVITDHPAERQIADPNYLGIRRTKDCIFIQVTLNAGRSVELKRNFYQAVADGLHERLGVRREDVFIQLLELPKENTSFGNGEAQFTN